MTCADVAGLMDRFDFAHERLIKDRPLDSGIIDTSRYVWPQ